MMDPERIRAYLQVACAGLGFDIGEVWWTSDESGTSTVATLEEKDDEAVTSARTLTSPKTGKRIRFMQLYTSKSYEDRRSKLVAPPSERRNDLGDSSTVTYRRSTSSSELEKHVLSPRLVEAVSNSAQVVWANCQRREGLLGRSDMRLQTAVGMPVAMDSKGNVCVVVMFSPNNVQSNDEAMEYLQCISKGAASTSIPCLLPVLDKEKNERKVLHRSAEVAEDQQGVVRDKRLSKDISVLKDRDNDSSHFLGNGVTARFVSFPEKEDDDEFAFKQQQIQRRPRSASVEIHTAHELASAPKDCYGIPMLPAFAELDCPSTNNRHSEEGSPLIHSDPFDEASYGVWSTIMNTPSVDVGTSSANTYGRQSLESKEITGAIMPVDENDINPDDILVASGTALSSSSRENSSSTVSSMHRTLVFPEQRERLEEFAAAFLGVSVFDAADAWIPSGGDQFDTLVHLTSVSVTDQNVGLNYFKDISSGTAIKIWSGAVGRAYGSGNPVWSANLDKIVDTNRVAAFESAKIKTALAVPIFSSGSVTPACVLCCYSLVRADSVPFVLRFVQQALRLLWDGLDRVEPHESVGKEVWKDVAPADLGEMAADVEMQQAFLVKKRPHEDISSTISPEEQNIQGASPAVPTLNVTSSSTYVAGRSHDQDSALLHQMKSLNMPSGEPSAPIQMHSPPSLNAGLGPAPLLPSTVQKRSIYSRGPPIERQNGGGSPPKTEEAFWAVQHAVRSVGEAIPWPVHQHISTTRDGSKRAHTLAIPDPAPAKDTVDQIQSGQVRQQDFVQEDYQQRYQQTTSQGYPFEIAPNRTPSPMIPDPQPTSISQIQPTAASMSYSNNSAGVPSNSTQAMKSHPQFSLSQDSSYSMQQQQQQQQTAPPKPSPSPPPQSSCREDPAVARANIDAFNAMARMQGNSSTTGQVSPQAQPQVVESSPSVAQSSAQAAVAEQVAGVVPSAPVTGQVPGSVPVPSVPHAEIVFPINTVGICVPTVTPVTPLSLNTSGKPCRIQGCNDLAVARRPYCLRHSGNRICEHDGCTKCAQGSTRFCIAHGGGRRCTFPGCDKGARDKFFCAAHGGGKRCSAQGCTKSAVGGSNLCTSHGGGRRCAVEGCEKSAQSSTKFCVKHGGGKKCAHSGCEKVARGRTLYCAGHGGGVRCKLEGCNRVAIGKAQLCRAHGGGSNRKPIGGSKNKSKIAKERVSNPSTSVSQSPPIMPSNYAS